MHTAFRDDDEEIQAELLSAMKACVKLYMKDALGKLVPLACGTFIRHNKILTTADVLDQARGGQLKVFFHDNSSIDVRFEIRESGRGMGHGYRYDFAVIRVDYSHHTFVPEDTRQHGVNLGMFHYPQGNGIRFSALPIALDSDGSHSKMVLSYGAPGVTRESNGAGILHRFSDNKIGVIGVHNESCAVVALSQICVSR